jgi:PAS domain S-box-containing protein
VNERRTEAVEVWRQADAIDLGLEPEVVQWLSAYALAGDDDRDSIVADSFAEANRLLHQHRSEMRGARWEGATYETQLRVLAEQMPAILWTTDGELRLTSYAGGGLAAMGVEPVVGGVRPLASILGAGDVAMRAMNAHACALRGESSTYEFVFRDRVYSSHIVPLIGAAGEIEGTIGVALDITDRKRAEDCVRASQQMLAHLLEQFPNGTISVVDAELRYVTVMGRGLAQMGLTHPDVIGRTLDELFAPEHAAVIEALYRRALAGAMITEDLPLADRTFALSAAPLTRAGGTVRSIVVVTQDITERIRAEQQRAARREQRARLEGMLFTARDLAARATHGLATSTGAIQRLSPEGDIPSDVRDAIAAATAGLLEATRAIAELHRVIDASSAEVPPLQCSVPTHRGS